MTDLTFIAQTKDCPPGSMLRVSLSDKRLLLANAYGRYYLVQEMCPHEDVSLYLGCLRGNIIQCSLHGSRFDLKTGEPLEEPAEEALQTYPVTVENEQIFAALKIEETPV